MGYSVEMSDALSRVPQDVLVCLRDALDEIAATLAALPPGGSAVNVFRGERMNLDLMGWRFQYEVEADRGRILVVEAQALAG